MKRTPLKRRGRLTIQWESIRRILKMSFSRAGITRCELKYPQCWGDYALGFAHRKKRRNCNLWDLWHPILACGPCHTAIEGMKEAAMCKVVDRIVLNRPVSPGIPAKIFETLGERS